MIVYRVIKYEGTEEALEYQLDKSLTQGVHKGLGSGIDITVIDLSDRAIIIGELEEHIQSMSLREYKGCVTRQQLKEADNET